MTIKEALVLIIEAMLLEEGKFSKHIEDEIIPKLKKQYGDPYKFKRGSKKRNEIAAKIFGTAQKIQNQMNKEEKED